MGEGKRRRSARPFDRKLLAGLIAGEERAWTRLVDEMHPKLIGHAISRFRYYGLTWGREEAEEIVQDVWQSSVRAIVGHERATLHRSYFYACVAKRVGRVIGREARRPSVSIYQRCGEDGTLIDVIPVPCDFVDAVDELEQWEDAMASLGETERYVIHRVYFQGATVAEVAAELDITEHQARYIKEQAIEKLRAFFERVGREVPAE